MVHIRRRNSRFVSYPDRAQITNEAQSEDRIDLGNVAGYLVSIQQITGQPMD